eukprot:SAG31_NODE_5737_length_2351_cov_1.333481_3_plen_156_part_00
MVHECRLLESAASSLAVMQLTVFMEYRPAYPTEQRSEGKACYIRIDVSRISGASEDQFATHDSAKLQAVLRETNVKFPSLLSFPKLADCGRQGCAFQPSRRMLPTAFRPATGKGGRSSPYLAAPPRLGYARPASRRLHGRCTGRRCQQVPVLHVK